MKLTRTNQPVCVSLAALRSFVAEHHDETRSNQICRNVLQKRRVQQYSKRKTMTRTRPSRKREVKQKRREINTRNCSDDGLRGCAPLETPHIQSIERCLVNKHLTRSINFLQMPNYLSMSKTRTFITVLLQDTTAQTEQRSVTNTEHTTKKDHEKTTHKRHNTAKHNTLPEKKADTYVSKHQPVCVVLSVLRSDAAEHHNETHDDRICRNILRTAMQGNSKYVSAQTHNHAQIQTTYDEQTRMG